MIDTDEILKTIIVRLCEISFKVLNQAQHTKFNSKTILGKCYMDLLNSINT